MHLVPAQFAESPTSNTATDKAALHFLVLLIDTMAKLHSSTKTRHLVVCVSLVCCSILSVALRAYPWHHLDSKCHTHECTTAASLAVFKQTIAQRNLDGQRSFSRSGWSRFPVIASCPPEQPLTRYGEGDGSKLLCRLDDFLLSRNTQCVVYSFGSNGELEKNIQGAFRMLSQCLDMGVLCWCR